MSWGGRSRVRELSRGMERRADHMIVVMIESAIRR